MLIAQITDIHLGFDLGNPEEMNRKRLDRVLTTLNALKPQPDMVFATGDLVEHGDVESYRQLREMLSALPFPVHYAMGNHDDRANFSTVFPERPLADGFLQYVVEGFPLRCIVLDTLDEGQHGGAFCTRRAAWLTARLDEASETPTLILLHHPPAAIGVDWMDPSDGDEWIERLAMTVKGRRNIVGMVSGHVHRAAVLDWRGIILAVTPSTAPSISLNLTEVDPEHPDDRPMIEAGEPGFALHLWTADRLVSHFAQPEAQTIARYTSGFQPLVREIYAGR
jgi:3',5'-cyclic AMP phosphodiesterase CpdA